MDFKIPLSPQERAAAPGTVCVTGVTGFVAGSIVARLLALGHTVHGTCRDPNDAKKVAHLQALPGAAQRLKLFKADLHDAASFDAPMAGCTLCAHTASPFILNVPPAKAREMLVEPALAGTRNVLAAVSKAGTVTRVVLTSSAAAVYGHPHERGVGHVFTTDDWNLSSSEQHGGYSYSKKVAEELAWEMAKAQSTWSLVVVNPVLVLGPPTGPRPDGESVTMISKLLNGDYWPWAPPFAFGCVDVRDVAAAHTRALLYPNASGRYLCSSGTYGLLEFSAALKPRFPRNSLPSPTTPMSKWLLSCLAPFVGISQEIITDYYNKRPLFDNSRTKQDLGIEFLDLTVMVNDMADELVKLKLAHKK